MVFFFIFILALIVRSYRMADLAVFLADQASDSLAVLAITKGHFTLLGPPTSVGGLYNGPIVYYLMTPFYWLLKGDPLAGTIFQTTLSVATVPFIYLIGTKLKNHSVGLLSAFLFAASPLMIDYSRAAFNAYPAIFFSTVGIYLFLDFLDHENLKKILTIGIVSGLLVQMHYLTISLLLLFVLYPALFQRKLISVKYYAVLSAGFVLGFSPFLLFELRHQFFNTRLFFTYLASSKETATSARFIFTIWTDLLAKLFLGDNTYLGFLMLIFIITVSIYAFVKKIPLACKNLSVFVVLFALAFFIGLIYGKPLQIHYVIAFHTSFIIMFALVINYLLKGKTLAIVLVCLFLLLINIPRWNWGEKTHPVQDDLSIADFKKAAAIVKKDEKTNYNVAMHGQGDNRAMPLRYTLAIVGEQPTSYENYAKNDYLYFIARKTEDLKKITMWEYTSFGPSYPIKKWTLNDQYFLYKLAKQ